MPEQQGEWVRLSEWKTDPPIVQVFTAFHLWPRLTRKQRQLVASCREEVNSAAQWPDRYKVVIDKLTGQPAATLRSLQAKGVVDERGCLTIPGIYTALWNQLDADADRRARRDVNRLASQGVAERV